MKERELKRRIDVGTGTAQVMTVGDWYRVGHFENEERARGAFELAYQQNYDGLGASLEQWLGITAEEVTAFMRDGSLPTRKK